MAMVTIGEAKANLSNLIARAEAGEEIVIARGRVPVARLEAIGQRSGKRGLAGIMKDKWPDLPDSFFFDPLPEDELAAWEGGQDNPG